MTRSPGLSPSRSLPSTVADSAFLCRELSRPTSDDGGLMARQVLNGLHRELLWKLTRGWPPPTLPAANLEDPAEHLLAKGLAEVVDGRLQATPAGYDLRATIEREEL
jgi:hypothetical protein